jgi:hypothetical protein
MRRVIVAHEMNISQFCRGIIGSWEKMNFPSGFLYKLHYIESIGSLYLERLIFSASENH